jgi:hypothetical protein
VFAIFPQLEMSQTRRISVATLARAEYADWRNARKAQAIPDPPPTAAGVLPEQAEMSESEDEELDLTLSPQPGKNRVANELTADPTKPLHPRAHGNFKAPNTR